MENPLLIEYFEGSNLVRKITCRPCGVVIFNITRETPKEETKREMTGLKAHLELIHDVSVDFVECSDPKCVEKHD